MKDSRFILLCKKVRATWPSRQSISSGKTASRPALLFKNYLPFLQKISKSSASSPQTFLKKTVEKNREESRCCSFDARHHHLLSFGTWFAKNKLQGRQLLFFDPREYEVASVHLKKLEAIGALSITWKNRNSIVQVHLENNKEQAVDDYTSTQPERLFLVARPGAANPLRAPNR